MLAKMENLQRYIFILCSIIFLNGFALSGKYETLTHIYETYHEGPGLNHYYSYGPSYDENIYQIRERAVNQGTKVRMLEIGVQSGGSTRVWKRYFRGTLEYVGVDINPRCKQFESPNEGITIRIGSQLDTKFLSDICTTYGPFDFVVDDGGHKNEMILVSLQSLWSCLKDNAVYVIEDLHALNMPGYLPEGVENVFETISKWMKVRSPRLSRWKTLPANISTSHPGWHLKKLGFFDSMLFLHYGENISKIKSFQKGRYWVPRIMSRKPRRPEICLGCCIGCYDD